MDKFYTKLFHRLLSSSIWDEDDKTRLVWITLLASPDEQGRVIMTMSKLARDARVDLPACEAAVAKFLAPDPKSLTAAHQGRRLEVIEGGWLLINHQKYQDMMSVESRRTYWREYRRNERAGKRVKKHSNYGPSPGEPPQHKINADGEYKANGEEATALDS